MGYMEIPAPPAEMRYPHDNNNSPLALDPPPTSSLISLFPPPSLNTTVPYTQDGTAYYSQVYGLDARSRLGSNSTSSTGMAHTQHHHHRTTPLPHPGSQISVRDQYTSATPGYRRDHPCRSPPLPGATLRRSHLSPTTSPSASFNAPPRMGSSQYNNRGSSSNNSVPPLLTIHSMGTLHYADGACTPIKVEISGNIDKGFFLAEGEWTCYRRNYFSCVCSFSLGPHYPTTAIHYTASNSSQPVQVFGFYMCISAVVSDSDSHHIDLVQHTPKRDKGPIMKPEKQRVAPKQAQPAHHHHMGMYTDTVGTTRSMYGDAFSSQPNGQQYPSECTFERIQFKQATQNNGKRRAAQQYYQLVVELWADVGQGPDQFVRIAYRKSAKMIVRGRSPGHYQNDRRGSQSSGPGGSAGSLSGYTPVPGMSDFGTNPMMGTPTYASFDRQSAVYSGMRGHDIPHETMMPPVEAKAIEATKDYQYYPGPIYETQTDRTTMYPARSESELQVPHMAMEVAGKVKNEYDGGALPSIFQSPPFPSDRRPAPFEAKQSSNDYYPTMMNSSITMT